MPIDPVAALALAVEHQAPKAAENLLLLLVTARSEAPAGQADVWEAAVRQKWAADVGAMGERMLDHVQATPEQADAFNHTFAAAVQARFAELRAGISTPAGRA